MRVTHDQRDVRGLIDELRRVLESVTWGERIPEPSKGRYRELVLRMFGEFGIGIVALRLYSDNRELKIAVVIRNLWNGYARVEGWVIDGDSVRMFKPYEVAEDELRKVLDEFGDSFWRYVEAGVRRLVEEESRGSAGSGP